MERYIYHPISGKRINLEDLEAKDAFITNRLFKPESWTKFYYDENDKNNMTYGIEIELNTPVDVVNNPHRRVSICKELLAVLNRDGKHFHIMQDNSVRNGIEIVSAPMTYKYWIETFNHKEINDLFLKLNLTATIDTGLHIHAGQKHTARLRELYLQLFAISYPIWIYMSDRRFERLQERYVSTSYFVKNDQLRTRYKATIKSLINTGTSKVSYENLYYYDYDFLDRYLGLNFFNEKTIEFRMFAGTNNFMDIVKYLTFVDVIVKLAKEISETRVNDIFDLDTFTKRAGCELILEETVKYIRFVNLIENQQRIYKNYFMFLDAYWYRVSINNVDRKEMALKKDVYKYYLSLIEKIKPTNPQHNCTMTLNFKKDIDLLLVNNLFEVVKVDKDSISMAYVQGATRPVVLSKHQANKEYVFLRGVTRHLMLKELKKPSF